MELYFGLVLMLAAAAATAAGMLALHHWLGPRLSNRVHEMPFECGNDPSRIVRGRLSVMFFLVALDFVLFEVELVFLFPWAVVFRELGMFGFVAMFVFLLVMVAGLFYTVKRGAFEWK
jgi:NADH-quinone oxidoreductase subunit A